MKKMTSSMLLASVLTLGTIAVPSILAATNSSSVTEEISEDAKTKLDEIRAEEKAGDITHEEAHEKLKDLGIDRSFGRVKHHEKGPFGNIDQETRTAIKDIRDQFKAGDLTEAEAQAKLDALDVDLPEDFLTRVNFRDLDEETKALLTEIREQFMAGELTEAEAQAKIKALGLDFEVKFKRGPHVELTDEQKAKLDSIRDQVEAGTLTKEEARTQMEELGLKPLKGLGRHGQHGPRGDFQPEDAPTNGDVEATTTTTSEA